MNTGDFEYLRGLVREKSGLHVNSDRAYLLESRLSPVARKWGHKDITSLVIALRGLPDQKLVRETVQAVGSSDTAFFKDYRVFRALGETVFPALIKTRASVKKLRVWSAATSTGQEAYSIAMVLKTCGAYAPGWTVEIVGSDMNGDALARATEANYSQFEVQRGLPIRMLVSHFDRVGERWLLKDEIKKLVSLKPFNLMDKMEGFGTFDVICLRNVLAQMDEAARIDVVKRAMAQLAKDGILVIGAGENWTESLVGWSRLGDWPGIYARTGSSLLR